MGNLYRHRLKIALILSLMTHALVFIGWPSFVEHSVEPMTDQLVEVQIDEPPPEQPELRPPPPPPPPPQAPTPPTSTPEPTPQPDPSPAETTIVDTTPKPPPQAALTQSKTDPRSTAAPAQSTQTSDVVSDASQLDNIDFKPFGNRKPTYPEIARQLGIEGAVVLEVLVGPKGSVEQVRIGKTTGHPSFAQSARNTAEKWRFAPPRRRGQSARVWYRTTVEFRLR